MNDWTALTDSYVIILTGVGTNGEDVIVARFAYEDDAKAFLANLRRRQPWNAYRVESAA